MQTIFFFFKLVFDWERPWAVNSSNQEAEAEDHNGTKPGILGNSGNPGYM